MTVRRRVLLSFPTSWDREQLRRGAPWLEPYELVLDEPADDDARWDLDILGYIEERARRWRGELQGVTSSSDYPGAIAAAALAERLGLAGAAPAAVLRASHKYCSRRVQQAAAPEAVPRFSAVDPGDRSTWPTSFPVFVKPVKASFSLFARVVRDARELEDFLTSSAVADFRAHYVRMFDQLAGRYAELETGASWFVAEEVLAGRQVTLEGWTFRGEPAVLGIVDTSFHPGTPSFSRFDYPSDLPPAVQERMAAIACRVVRALDLDGTLFNLELVYDEQRDRIGIIEINPRPCGQFADLYEKVDGTNGCEIALALACGERPLVRRRTGAFAAAASFPLRSFRAVHVRHAPDPAEVRAIEEQHAGSRVWVECRTGERLETGRHHEDGHSARYAVLNLGAATRRELEEKRLAIERALAISFEPLDR